MKKAKGRVHTRAYRYLLPGTSHGTWYFTFEIRHRVARHNTAPQGDARHRMAPHGTAQRCVALLSYSWAELRAGLLHLMF